MTEVNNKNQRPTGKEKKANKKSIPPRKLKPLNNLGDILRNVPSLSNMIEKIDKKNAQRAAKAKNKGNRTQDKLSNGHQRYGHSEADQ